jgi:hypothetical protein
MYGQIKSLAFARYRFELEALDPVRLPKHWGSSLRGALGHALKRTACRQEGERCARCSHYEHCAYGYVFETHPHTESDVLRSHRAVPRPFVLEPGSNGGEYQKGDSIFFELILMGKAISYFPYFIWAFKILETHGLGQGRGRVWLKRAWSKDILGPWETLIYDGQSDALQNINHTAGIEDLLRTARQMPDDALTIHFLTPTRIKVAGTIAREISFQLLIRNITRRLSSLAYFHCDEQWETDYRTLIANAGGVRTTKSDFEWEGWKRWSSRQRRRIPQGGLTGVVNYAGQLGSYRLLLLLGSVVHVGKSTVTGHGKYAIEK